MIELALLAGLGAVGYLLATDASPMAEGFVSAPRPMARHSDDVVHAQAPLGHNNEVPAFGARVTQSMYSGATNHVMDNHTGAGKEYFQKREVKSFFDAKPGSGNPFGNAVETDFEQSRMVSGQNMKNVFPIEQVQVGPGANDGYTNIPRGGFQQDQLHEFMLPKTTDETRIVTNPKLSYEPPVIPGANRITQPGIQADVNKNKPDRFAVLGMDRANTTVGAQTAARIYSEQPMKVQARESTSVQHNGSAGGSAVFSSYIRAFTEPYQEFMRLTAEGRPGPAGAQGTGITQGAEGYAIQTRKDEGVLSDAARFNVPVSAITSGLEHLGSYRYNEPLQQDVLVSRNNASVVKAFQENPYTQKLNSF